MDGKNDKIIISTNNSDERKLYLLEIFFKKGKGYSKLFSSDKTLWPRYPDGEITYATVEELEIKNGVLIIRNQLLKSNFTHKFRFENGKFELIG